MNIDFDVTAGEEKRIGIALVEHKRVLFYSVFFSIFSIFVALFYSMPEYWGVSLYLGMILKIYFFVAAISTPYIAYGIYYSNPRSFLLRVQGSAEFRRKMEIIKEENPSK